MERNPDFTEVHVQVESFEGVEARVQGRGFRFRGLRLIGFRRSAGETMPETQPRGRK